MMLNSRLGQNMHLGPSYVMLILRCCEMVEGGGAESAPLLEVIFKRDNVDPKVLQSGKYRS